MNTKMQQDDRTRDQSRRFDKQHMEEKHRHQAGKDQQDNGREGQQQAENPPRNQQGGWNDEEQGGRKPAMDRDRDYDPDGDRAGRIDRE